MKRVVHLKLSSDEARSLEIELDSVIKRLHDRSAVANGSPFMHEATEGLIDRYTSIRAKVREARNPTPARQRANA